jgi:hypothetical protein
MQAAATGEQKAEVVTNHILKVHANLPFIYSSVVITLNHTVIVRQIATCIIWGPKATIYSTSFFLKSAQVLYKMKR